MHRIDAGKEYMEGEKHLASEGMETLSKKHRIISVHSEAVPEYLKGYALIHYLPSQDILLISGWKENNALITMLMIEYLELTPYQHDQAVKRLIELEPFKSDIELWQALETIYQLRKERQVRNDEN